MQNTDYLKIAERRHDSVKRYNPESAELGRLISVVAEIRSRMTAAEIDEFDNRVALTPEQERAKIAADLKQMAENRDREGI